MITLAKLYNTSGHTRIGFETLNLIQGAMILSTTNTKASVMQAAEAIRKGSTFPNCQWNLRSFSDGIGQVLLRTLEKPRMINNFKRKAPFPSPIQPFKREAMGETYTNV